MAVIVLILFPVAVVKYPDKSTLLKKGVFGSQSQGPVCSRYFSIVVMKHHDQGNLRKREFILAYGSRGRVHDSRVEAASPDMMVGTEC